MKYIHFSIGVVILCQLTLLFSGPQARDHNKEEISIILARTVSDIDLKASRDILVSSFMSAYEDIPLTELNPLFKSTGDVRRFYQRYFQEELDHFKEGHLFWVQAFCKGQLVGWATFELETQQQDAAYMNLLVVDPEHQKKGIGKRLVFSICEEVFPHITCIYLLLRKINQGGYKFYHKLGFVDCDYQRENFVDPALLTGLKWVK